jgi:RNA polymerase sigma-70 factor (ECF subfamily)
MVDLHRRRSRPSYASVTRDETGVATELPPVADLTDRVLDRTVVTAALDRLSPGHREVIVETYLLGRSYEELSADCGVPPGTLRSRMFYALKALRATMDEMGVSL